MDSLPRSPTLFISFLTKDIMFNYEPRLDRIQKVTVAHHWNQNDPDRYESKTNLPWCKRVEEHWEIKSVILRYKRRYNVIG